LSWPVPAPGDIANRAAAVYEQALPGIDARSDNTVATTNTRITEMAMQDLYFDQANCANETMPDTAVANLPRHAAIWGVPRVPASAAAGNIVVSASSGQSVPAGLMITSNAGQTYTTIAAVTAGSGNSAIVPVQATSTGAAGNLAANAPVTIMTPNGALLSQSAVVDGSGLTGGADIQSLAAWRAAIIAKIQDEPSGGDFRDYVDWTMAALPNVALAACPAGACGGGVVSVVFLMAGFVPPTEEQIAVVAAYIATRRPVTATVNVYAGTLKPVPVTLHVSPNTAAIQAAAQAALALSFQQDAAIGGTTYVSRLDNAISASDGEYYHELVTPAADVPAPSLFALNTLGPVSFV
jgi:uncharacterized phage protein gp47/JayE